ncbi:MAG: NAD+ synthase [Phycisphaerales bacterium]|nr:MAG: NAD+ synthase [Phycisphaerales bacterium]
MRLALCQLNPTVGDLAGNTRLAIDAIRKAHDQGARLIALPELSICGYPPRDLLLMEGFVGACERAADELGREAGAFTDATIVLGTPLGNPDGSTVNALIAFRAGDRIATYRKRLLPTYDVFDEDRYFEPGDEACVIEVGGVRVGLAICEDLWQGEDAGFKSRYARCADPVAALASAGAQVLVVPSASPFVLGKGLRHHRVLASRAERHGLWVASVNQVGGNDDLIFDGYSTVHAPNGRVTAAGPGFEPAVVIADIDPRVRTPERPIDDPRLACEPERLAFHALRVGVRDYLRKTGFAEAVLGLSGGIDSAVTGAIAVAALGADRVVGVAMPSVYSSSHSIEDANDLAERLGIPCPIAPIGEPLEGFQRALDPLFAELGHGAIGASRPDVAEENLQSRVRGALMMALSNRTGAILLTTGNKSELAVGYCTLYGDMNGGLAVLSDCTKQLVYALARWINAHHAECGFARPPIPERTIEKPPSAELAPDQLDSDSLPAYEELDAIVERRIERHQSAETIAREAGIDAATVARIVRLIDVNEYKRKQTAVGLKITSVAFGPGRRMPIAQRWRE